MKTVLIFFWFVCLMTVWTLCGEWISAPNTFLNVLGGVVGLGFIITTIKTRCFTEVEQVINKKKKEKQ